MGVLEKDQRFLEAALPELKDYLFSSEIYWPLPALSGRDQTARFFRLTPGNLLVSKTRLEITPVSSAVETLFSRFNEIRDRWRAHWMQKIEKEIPARLSLWSNFLREAKEDGITLAEYRYQVRLRAMLKLLAEELPTPPRVYDQQLPSLDQLVEAITFPGPFVWEAQVMPAFPEVNYWFLYRTPEKEEAG